MMNIFDKLKFESMARALALCCALTAVGMVDAQVTGQRYQTTYQNQYITHKRAKWYDLRESLGFGTYDDDFDEDASGYTLLPNGTTNVQTTHVIVDTIYMQREETVTLKIYDTNSGVSSGYNNSTSINNRTYQRWYNYETDGLLRSTSGNTTYDLLTPVDGNAQTRYFYKFANGYIGKPLSSNADFIYANFYFPSSTENDGKSEYIVACDVSGYEDFTLTYDKDATTASSFTSYFYEPTLSHRYIYYIIATGEGDVEPHYSDLHITMPATRLPGNTNEMVALPKDAFSYTGSVDGTITVEIESGTNSAGISLVSSSSSSTAVSSVTMDDDDRNIFFIYPTANSDGTRSVTADSNGDSEARIMVKNGNEVIMSFYLTFKEESRLLAQNQLNRINEYNNGTYTPTTDLLPKFSHRDPEYLMGHLELLTELNFDFNTEVGEAYGQSQYYPFPLGWDDMSAGFYDGSASLSVNDYTAPTANCPEWGYYGITNSYVESDADGWNKGIVRPADSEPIRYNSSGEQSSYHIYVDAGNRAERFARIPFQENLCGGTELYVTAWVKCATYTYNSTGNDNAGAMFSIMGVTEDEEGNTKYVPVYRFQTGQIPYTIAATSANTGITSEGYDTSRNDWMQVYFSFINDDETKNYGSYVLEVENASASTNGADLYFDDIRIYIGHANAVIEQLNAACSGESTLMSMSFDWDRLTSRLGVNTEQEGTSGIDYCFIDKNTYDNYLAENPGSYAAAIDAAAIPFSDGPNTTDDVYEKYNTVYFHNVYTDNDVYGEHHPQLASEIEDYLYRTEDALGTQTLIADFYANFSINKTYWLLLNPSDGTEPTAATFAQDLDEPCVIKTSFLVTSQFIVRINGDVVNPETTYCKGQVLNIPVQVRVPTGVDETTGLETYETLSEGIYYDWFIGSEDEFVATNTTYNVSLQEALQTFRDVPDYLDKENLDGVTSGTYLGVDGFEVKLTDEMISVIDYYLNQTDYISGQPARLVLHQSSVNLTFLSDTLFLVIQPIPVQLEADEEDAYDWENICWEYIPLVLTASSQAPTLHAGFSDIAYPSDHFNPSFRIGLDQIGSANASNPITVDLQEAVFTELDSDNPTDHVGMISGDEGSRIYLVSSDDPAYASLFPEEVNEESFTYSYPIGTLTSLYAINTVSSDNVAKLYFDTETVNDNGFQFTPREGYTYTFAVYFQEYTTADESSVGTSCYGNFTVPMKVVPQYLVWQGTDANTNWNNDTNWKRADKADLLKADDDTYTTNAENTTDKGFVPMLFSNVVMPTDSRARLYMAGFNAETERAWTETLPSGMETPTENVMYDLMVYEDNTGFSTQPFRVNLCDNIHFSQGAQMMHAEQLIYNTASMDIAVANNAWTTVSTPLKNIVAGDWYTGSTGEQTTEYFQDITFTSDYSRVNPAVFQRTWSDAANILKSSDGSESTPVSFSANWSAAYNDASVAYNPGAGYSIRGWKTGLSELQFRMPKADETYDYSSSTTLARDENGKLLISDMLSRTPENDYSVTSADVTVTLSAANGDENYLMVGNPYMADLDAQAFVEANSDVLAQMYWVVGSDGSLQEATYDASSSEWSVGTSYVAPFSVFYVKAANESATSVDVKFSEDMQAFDETSSSAVRALLIRASSESGTSMASVNYSDEASNDYDRLEDAELISGLGETEGLQVFTAAGNYAISANQVNNMTRIPLGVYAADDELVTVTFENVEAVENAGIYDAELDITTPLYNGYVLELTGNSYGRYFLIGSGSGATGVDELSVEEGVQVSSMLSRQVVVTSASAISEVSIWSASGMLQSRQLCGGAYTCTISGVTSGVAIVHVTTENGVVSRKLIVK